MNLLCPKQNECPVCHKPQRTKALCSACARTGELFPGVRPGHAERKRAEQLSMFGSAKKR